MSEGLEISLPSLHGRMTKKNPKSKIDQFIISKVKEMRESKGLTQEDIAIHLNLSTGFIGHIESSNYRAKYNTQHLNELAKLFRCSPKEFIPDKAL